MKLSTLHNNINDVYYDEWHNINDVYEAFNNIKARAVWRFN